MRALRIPSPFAATKSLVSRAIAREFEHKLKWLTSTNGCEPTL